MRVPRRNDDLSPQATRLSLVCCSSERSLADCGVSAQTLHKWAARTGRQATWSFFSWLPTDSISACTVAKQAARSRRQHSLATIAIFVALCALRRAGRPRLTFGSCERHVLSRIQAQLYSGLRCRRLSVRHAADPTVATTCQRSKWNRRLSMKTMPALPACTTTSVQTQAV